MSRQTSLLRFRYHTRTYHTH